MRALPAAVVDIIADVIPLLLIVAGLVALALGGLVLRSFGSAYRIGRLLATTPQVTVDAALAMAETGTARYVRVEGRLDSEADFEDEHHRPLVFRRRRIEAQASGRWRVLDENREAVPFEVREGLSSIAIDPDALDQGLVVIRRESIGTAGEVSGLLGLNLPPATPVRLWVDQVSSVEHAIVLGVPLRNGHGQVRLTGTAARPLVLTTLEVPEAMRVLGGGDPARPRLAAALLVLGGALLTVGVLWAIVQTVA